MKPVTIKEFIKALNLSLSKITPELTLKVIELNPHRFKGRIDLSAGRFVNIFYSPNKGRIDFALINNDKRIWGIDNLAGWHFHPLWNERDHVKTEYTSLEDIVKELKAVIENLADSSP